MIAVIKTCGKQYKVKEKQILKLDSHLGEVGKAIEFSEVLLWADEDGKEVTIGTPLLTDKKVVGKVLSQGRSRKVEMIRYKRKVREQRKRGFRQDLTTVLIEKV